MKHILITHTPLDPLKEQAHFQAKYLANNTQSGATVAFTGTMRDFNDDNDVTGMFLDHYPRMAEVQLEQLINKAYEQWSIDHCMLVHRVGQLYPSDPIVLVVIWSAHRSDAFNAARYIMNQLKKTAPFWKKETLRTGETRWVEKNTADQVK